MTRGAIYIVHGERYIREALDSVASLKRAMPGLPITFFCDGPVDNPFVDQVVRIERNEAFPGCAAKIPHIAASPYEQTVFLDSDTYICGSLEPLFEILAAFDLAAAHSPSRAIYAVAAPDSFPEFNTGIIAYRSTPDVKAFFTEWAVKFTDYLERVRRDAVIWHRPPDQRFHVLNDQGVFREALFESRLRIATLPPEYNCRFNDPGYLEGEVKILHGRGIDLPQAAAEINARLMRRGFEQRAGRIRLKHFYEPSDDPFKVASVRYMLRRQGVAWMAKTACQRLARAVSGMGRGRA